MKTRIYREPEQTDSASLTTISDDCVYCIEARTVFREEVFAASAGYKTKTALNQSCVLLRYRTCDVEG